MRFGRVSQIDELIVCRHLHVLQSITAVETLSRTTSLSDQFRLPALYCYEVPDVFEERSGNGTPTWIGSSSGVIRMYVTAHAVGVELLKRLTQDYDCSERRMV